MAEPNDPRTAVPPDLSGRIGKYEILRPLGKGAMGQVYVAHDTVLDRDVALKVMAAQIADDAELKLRFEREARAVAKMTHPNVVTVFDLGSHSDGSPFIAMELLRGQDLQKAMRQMPPPSLEKKVAIIVQVLAGLAHAHQAGIVHRDIKPANIFIQEEGSVKIMDFGVARLTTAAMTATGNIVGTADYMSPEQVQGAKVDGRSDVFSVGCMLFELIAGRRPFHSESLMAIFYKITHEDPSFELIPQKSEYEGLLPLLRKALAKDAGQRYQTAAAFGIDLRDWLKAHATSASSQNVLESLVDFDETIVPGTEVPGDTAGGAAGPTANLDSRRTGALARRATVSARPAARPAPSTGARSATRRPATLPARARAQGRGPVPWIVGAFAVAGLAMAGYLLWQGRQPVVPEPDAQGVASPVSSPPVSPPPLSVPPLSVPPVTAAPQPTFAQAEGQAAVSIRAAQAAFNQGNYVRAVSAAQQALREDSASGTAKALLENALVGQQAALRVSAAEAALAKGELGTAGDEIAAALKLAPWDRAAVAARSRIEAAKLQAQRDAELRAQQAQRETETRSQAARAAQTNALLNEATTAMERKQFEAAIAVYNRLLELDPGNMVAHAGKSNALTAKTVAEAGGRGGGVMRTFVAGRTEAKGVESASGGPLGFEESAGVVVRRGTQAAELPGRIVFEASPASPQPGERFGVAVFLRNEGSQPIQLASMQVATTLDGKAQKGALPPLTRTVAPRDRALVFQVRDQVWREGTSSWTMEVVLITAAGDNYRNALSWK